MRRLQKILNSVFLPALLTAMAASASAQSINAIDPGLRERIDRIARQVLEQTGVPSASVAVVQHGKLVYTHAYGSARLATTTLPPSPPRRRCATPSGPSPSSSPPPPFCCCRKRASSRWTTRWASTFPASPAATRSPSAQILSHTSGYQDYWPEDYVMTPMLHPESAQQILDTWAKKPLDFEPGTQWQYSNTNFVIAGRIVEKVTGEPLMDFLTQRIFRPLGMKSVWNSDEAKLTQADATAYYRHALGPLRVAPKEGRGWMFAAGELAMTAHDLALWDESLIAQSILKPESYKQMFTEVKLKDGKGTHYGLGVEVRDRNGHRSIEHSGEVSGFVSDNEVLVDDGVAVAVLTNQDAVGAASTIARLAAPRRRRLPANRRRKAGPRDLPRPAAGPHRPQPAGPQPQRLLHRRGPGRLPEQPGAAGRAAHLPPDPRSSCAAA